MGVALYFIDKLALRAGHEKDDDEADTVGCCNLKARAAPAERSQVSWRAGCLVACPPACRNAWPRGRAVRAQRGAFAAQRRPRAGPPGGTQAEGAGCPPGRNLTLARRAGRWRTWSACRTLPSPRPIGHRRRGVS
jgi:hypothetical protein